MEQTHVTLLLLTAVAAVIPVVLVFVLHRMHQSRAESTSTVSTREVTATCSCPSCGRPMKPGLAIAPKGIHWRELHQPRGLRHMTIFGALPNTLHRGFRMRQNPAWCCDACSLLLMDHSRMVG